MKTRAIAAVLIAAVTFAVPHEAVGASSPTSKLKHEAGEKVLKIINAENAAIQKAKAKTDFAAVSHDFSNAATKLRAVKYPKSAKADAKALEGILDTLSYDAGQLALYAPKAKAGTVAAITDLEGLDSTVLSNEGTELADSDALRADLGLPPAKVTA